MKDKTSGEIEQARLNRLYFMAFGEGGMFVDLLKDLERKFDHKSLLRRGPDGKIDPLEMAAKCGQYDMLSSIWQSMRFGEQNK